MKDIPRHFNKKLKFFNADPTKKAQKIINIRKTQNQNYPPVVFKNNSAEQFAYHKHLGLILNSRFNF